MREWVAGLFIDFKNKKKRVKLKIIMRVYVLKELETLIFCRQKCRPGRNIFKSLCMCSETNIKGHWRRRADAHPFFTVWGIILFDDWLTRYVYHCDEIASKAPSILCICSLDIPRARIIASKRCHRRCRLTLIFIELNQACDLNIHLIFLSFKFVGFKFKKGSLKRK